jgi:bifunctional non-homologous end joining protein LigD
MGLEGVISKRLEQPYMPGNRGLWLKSKCLNREEFVVVGWTDPAGSRSHFGALLLGYYTEDSRLHYAGRAGTGFNERELARLAGVLKPLETPRMPLHSRRRVRTVSARRWSYRACIGSGRKWSWK